MPERFFRITFLAGAWSWLRLTLASLPLFMTTFPAWATAAEVRWSNPAGGIYQFGTNWTGGKVPGKNDSVTFNLGGAAYTVASLASIETSGASGLVVQSDSVSLLLGNAAWNSQFPVYVGGDQRPGDHASLTIVSGHLATSSVYVGDSIKGSLIVEGSSSRFSTSGVMYVGSKDNGSGGRDGSNGEVAIRDGGQISAGDVVLVGFGNNTTGSVVVTGANSKLISQTAGLNLGVGGTGSLQVMDSARVEFDGNLRVGGDLAQYPPGWDAAGYGEVLVQNSEATFGGQISLGIYGAGKLTIDNSIVTSQQQLQLGTGPSTSYGRSELVVQNGAVVNSFAGQSPTTTSAIIAGSVSDSSGSALITGAGSQWLQDGNFSVGSIGAGTLRIEDGGYVKSKDAQVARTTTASANVQVDGQDSVWLMDDRLIIGGAFAESGGMATVVVSDNGLVTVGQHLHLWEQGTLDVSQQGAVIVGDSAAPIVSAVLVNSGGTLSGTGNIIGDVLVAGGTLAPGASPGVLHIDGDLTIAAGSQLLMELGGLTSGTDYDQLDVTGNTLIDGLVTISLINGFVPNIGDEFTLFKVDGQYNAAQAQFVWLNAPSGLSYEGAFVDGSFTVSITAVPEPSTWLLVACGAVVLPVFRRWRQR